MKNKTRTRQHAISLLIVLAIAVMALAGCGQNAEVGGEGQAPSHGKFPVTIMDDLGNEVTFEQKPETIVSLSPANTEILFALGLGEKVAARTDYCNYPVEAAEVPSIGDFNAPNLEKIISLAPDLIMATDFIQDDIRAQLESTGAKVVVYSAQSIDAVMQDIEKTGQIMGTSKEAEQLIAAMQEKRVAVAEAVKKAQGVDPLSVFIDIGDFYSAGEDSLLGSLLTELNLKNIAADTGMQWPQLPVETIVAANPDVYISFYTKPEELRKMAGLNVIQAVKNDRILYYEMLSPKSDLIQRPGPRIVDGLEQLAVDMMPEAFE